MRSVLIFVATLSVLLVGPLVQAGDESIDSIYESVIDKKIDRCESQAVCVIHSQSSKLRSSGLRAYDMANFYRRNKDELVKAMVKQDVNASTCSIDYFLIKAYHDPRGRAGLFTEYIRR